MKKITKKMATAAAVTAAAAAMAGCCTQSRILGDVRDARFTGIVDHLAPGKIVPQGQAKLTIEASLKTRRPGDYLFERRTGAIPERPMLLNVDGQTVRIEPKSTGENRTGNPKSDAEAGEGIRYDFAQSFSLPPGRHILALAIPEEGIAVEREVRLKEGENRLTARPVYAKARKTGLGPRNGEPTFVEGISRLRLFLNGEPI